MEKSAASSGRKQPAGEKDIREMTERPEPAPQKKRERRAAKEESRKTENTETLFAPSDDEGNAVGVTGGNAQFSTTQADRDDEKSNIPVSPTSDDGIQYDRDGVENLEGELEAILFTMGEPVELERLASAVQRDRDETKAALDRMKIRYRKNSSGIQLLELDGSYQLCTKKQYYKNLIAIASQPKKPRLTEVLMETLSIIAYRQPVTKAEIEKIRGVSSDHAVNRLLEYGLVEEAGRLDAPGKPILFRTTDAFLRTFGLDSAEHLPEVSPVQMEDFRAEAEAEADIQVEV